MKKIVLAMLTLVLYASAEVISVVPYIGYINYDANIKKSIKNSSKLGGIYTNIGTLNYLLEFNYSYLNTEYKTQITDINLEQNDFTLNYASYNPSFMYKFGVHYTNTNDIVLGNAIVLVGSVGGYTYKWYDKYSYGLDMYYSFYKNGRDEQTKLFDANFNYIKGSFTNIIQFSPYFSYFDSISINTSNLIYINLDYQYAFNYVQKNYLSVNIGDTFYYKSFFLDVSGYKGEMRSGVKNGGLAVYNSLNLMKYGAMLKVGYYLTPAFVANVSYSTNLYQEYSLNEDTLNSIAVASLSYRF